MADQGSSAPRTVFCDTHGCSRVAFLGIGVQPTFYYCGEHSKGQTLRGREWWHANREGEDRLVWVLTDDQYRARGAVVRVGGRYIGYDTAGGKLFDRKDYAGALVAAHNHKLVTVARGYYGIDSPHHMDGMSAPENMRRKCEEVRNSA
jgi:hypothetical protein